MGQGRRKRGQYKQRPVKVFVAKPLQDESEHDATGNGERIIQRYAGSAQAAVDLAPQQDEQRRSNAACQGCRHNEGVGKRWVCQGRNVCRDGEPKQKGGGSVDPAPSCQRRDAVGEQSDGDSAGCEHDVVGELPRRSVDRHGRRRVRVGERHPGAPQGEAEEGLGHIEQTHE